MLGLKVFCVLCYITVCMCDWTRYPVPYEYLTSRNVKTGKVPMDKPVSSDDVLLFATLCRTRCYLPVYWEIDAKTSANISYYQILEDADSSLCYTSPNCLAFNQSQYLNYSLIYSKECSYVDETVFEPKKCPDDWEVFLRADGRRWCYKVFQSPDNSTNFTTAAGLCAKENAFLNGVESALEYNAFIKYTDPVMSILENKSCAIGAIRKPSACGNLKAADLQSCLKGVEFKWPNEVSRNPKVLYLPKEQKCMDGSGYCLTYAPIFDGYDDVSCSYNISFYACGKYAS